MDRIRLEPERRKRKTEYRSRDPNLLAAKIVATSTVKKPKSANRTRESFSCLPPGKRQRRRDARKKFKLGIKPDAAIGADEIVSKLFADIALARQFERHTWALLAKHLARHGG